MSIPLYDATVRGFIQVVDAMHGVLQRGLDHCKEKGIDTNDVVATRLHPDMLPFAFQVYSVVKNSAGAIDCAREGKFGMPPPMPALDYSGLQRVVAEGSAKLKSLGRDEVEAWQGRDLIFQPAEYRVEFTVEDFLLSFSVPNVHFHATTAYDILRMKGVPLGKRDYLGRLAVKGMK